MLHPYIKRAFLFFLRQIKVYDFLTLDFFMVYAEGMKTTYVLTCSKKTM